ncbi:MAG: four helix bundle protein [Planctomycetes bacterium]|nr:four helix bundle protein [Planctomycetota bacterium]
MGNLSHARGFKDLVVYQKAREVSREIFEISKTLPREEIYSLTDQLRRASRSMGGQMAEASPSDRPRARRRAFAILTVVLILFGMAVIGMPFLLTMRIQNQASQNQLAQVQARYSAAAAAHHAMAVLVRTLETYEATREARPFATPTVDTASELEVSLTELGIPFGINPRGLMASVSIQDEQGKININTAPALLLENICRQAECSNPALLAQATVFFRTRFHQFRTLGELRLCADIDLPAGKRSTVTSDELERLRSLCTVHSVREFNRPGARHPVNVNTAARDVLIALFRGLSVRDSLIPEVILAVRADGQPNTGNGVLSELSFPAGFGGPTWTLECTAITGGNITFSVSNGTTEVFKAYTFTPASSPLYLSDGAEISFRITDGSVDFAAGDRFIIDVNESGTAVTQAASEKVADRIRAATTLAAAASPGDGQLRLTRSSHLPKEGWVNLEGDLVQFTDNDQAGLLTVSSTDAASEAGVALAHAAGAAATLVLTNWSDLDVLLQEAQAAGDLGPDEREAIYLNAVNPEGRFVARSTAGMVFHSGDTYTAEAAGILNSPEGEEIGKVLARRVLQPSQSGESAWETASQTAFLALIQQNQRAGLITHSSPASLHDQPDVSHHDRGILVSSGPDGGDEEIDVSSATPFRVGQRIEISGEVSGVFHQEPATVIRVDRTARKLYLDRPLVHSYPDSARVGPAGAVALEPSRVVTDAATDTAAQHFDGGWSADFTNLETNPGTGTKVKNAGSIDTAASDANVGVEGLYVGPEDVQGAQGGIAYRADDGNIATSMDAYGLSVHPGQIEFWFKPYWGTSLSNDFHLLDMASDEYQNRLSLKVSANSVAIGEPHLVLRITDGVVRDADVNDVDEAHISEIRVPITLNPSHPDSTKRLLESGVWHHVRMVWKGTYYGQLALFLDGRLVGSYWPAASLAGDIPSEDPAVGFTAATDALTPRTSEYPPEFNSTATGTKVMGGEIVEHDPAAASSFTVPIGSRQKRRTVARSHSAGEPVTLFGYVYNIEQYYWYSFVYFPTGHVMLGSPPEYSALAHNLSAPGKEPGGTVRLQDPNEFNPNRFVGEWVDDGGPDSFLNFTADGKLAETAEVVPYVLASGVDDFPSSGFVLLFHDEGGGNTTVERVFYDRVEKNKSLKVKVEVTAEGQPPVVENRTLSLDVLHVWGGPPGQETPQLPQGRGNLGSDPPKTYQHGDAVSLISVQLRSDADLPGNTHYARGYYRPKDTNVPQSWLDAGFTADDWLNGPGREQSGLAFVALGDRSVGGVYEWIAYTWPTVGPESTPQSGDDTARRLVVDPDSGGTVEKHYLVGILGLGRQQAGTTGGAFAGSPAPPDLATVVFPVLTSSDSRIGVNDRVTLRDDDGNQEEKVILHASSNGSLFTLASKETPTVPAFVSQRYDYAKNPRLLKFPTGRRPELPSTNLWIGCSAPIGTNNPKDPAQAVFDEIRIRRTSLENQSLHSVLLYSGGEPPAAKRVADAARMATPIGPDLLPPFGVRVGNLAQFLDRDQVYPTDDSVAGRWFTALGIAPDTKLPAWMWLSNSSQSWPRFGYLKVDDEALFYQMLYWHPDGGAVANVSISDSIPEGNPSGIIDIQVDSTEGFAEAGYAIIEFMVRNTSYWTGADPWMRNPDGGSNAAEENPGYLGKRWDGLLTLYDHPYCGPHSNCGYYHPHHAPRYEVVFYASKTSTAFQGVQRGILDSIPYPVVGPGNSLFDWSESGPPATFSQGITSSAGKPPRAAGLAGNSFLRVRPLQGVELEILQRGALGTARRQHVVGSTLMPLEGIPNVLLTGPLQPNGILPAYSRALADSNNLSDERLFPERGMLELPTGEVVGYSARSASAFGGVHVLRERYGTAALVSNEQDYITTLPLVVNLDTDPTPDLFPDNVPAAVNGSPYVARLLPHRYFDGLPRAITVAGSSAVARTDYDAPGTVFLATGRTVPGAVWKSLSWSEGLPAPASSSEKFKTHVVARIGGVSAPGWDADPAASATDGLFHFTSEADPDPGDALVGPFYFTADGNAPDADDPGYRGDEIEVRIFFEFPRNGYVSGNERSNDWKKTPYFDRLKLTYEAAGRVLQQEDMAF